jgi:vancomycin resistance protein YoaR
MRRVALVIGGLLIAAAIGATTIRAIEFDGAAKPGVSVLGVDMGGKSQAQIESALRAWGREPVTIRAAGRSYHVPRAWLVSLDVTKTSARALAAGTPLALVLPAGVDVEPVIRRAGAAGDVLEQLARSETRPVPAAVSLRGTQVVVTRGRDGRRLDRSALLRRLAAGARLLDAPFVSVRPAIRYPAARSAGATAELLVAQPVALDYHGARLGALSRLQLARALRIRARTHRFAVGFDPERLAHAVRPRLGRWLVPAHNAQFAVSGDRVRVVPARPGRDVDPLRLAVAVTAAAHEAHRAKIELGGRDPDLTTTEARSLGIRQRLVSFTTQMGESSSNRIHNVHLMADFIDGTVIEPGQVFSFNNVVGERTAARGFLEGQEIIGSLVLPSIGGGVCQTATTLFNDAFELGLPILARTNHNLYLSHYPLGRDATVAWGGPDFEFRNDLKHGILIKTTYTDSTLTFTFYGTPEHRRIVARTGPQTNWTHPGMSYAVDPSASRGSVRIVAGTGELGFDVTVYRKVYDANGKLTRSDAFKSHYIPDSSTTVYGPGRTPPGPYFVLPSSL